MPVVRTRVLKVMADDIVEIHWVRIHQTPGVSPPEYEQETLVEQYTAPPDATWRARAERLGGKGKDKEEEEEEEEP